MNNYIALNFNKQTNAFYLEWNGVKTMEFKDLSELRTQKELFRITLFSMGVAV